MPDPTTPRPDEVPARHDRLAAAMLTPLTDYGLREAVKWVMEPELLAIEAEVEKRVRQQVARENAVLRPTDLAELLNYVVGHEGAPVTTLRDALDRLTDDERRLILRSLAARYPAEVEQQAAYVHSRRVWYPTPPTPKVTP